MELSKEHKVQLIGQQLLSVAASRYDLFLAHGAHEASGDGDSEAAKGAAAGIVKMDQRTKWLNQQLHEIE